MPEGATLQINLIGILYPGYYRYDEALGKIRTSLRRSASPEMLKYGEPIVWLMVNTPGADSREVFMQHGDVWTLWQRGCNPEVI